jgi:exodeoxyribonuclease V beta subunit
MHAIRPFAPLSIVLTGTHLIEASAGTGKTHAITDLYLRLILEIPDVSVEKLLVVTFTEAATQELRDRIRRRLRSALAAFADGRATDDPLLQAMAASLPDRAQASRRLRQALADFDEAAIFTIHGFCYRVLSDLAYESKALFDTQLVTSQEELLTEIVADFWRIHFYEASPLLVAYAISQGCGPHTFLELVMAHRAHQWLETIPRLEPPDIAQAELAFRQAYAQAAQAWPACRNEVIELLVASSSLKKTSYKEAFVRAWKDVLDRYLSGQAEGLAPACVARLTPEALAAAQKKNACAPEHLFFDRCAALWRQSEILRVLFDRRLQALKASVLAYVRQELAARKRDRNVQFFDDLLTRVSAALRDQQLARAIRRRYWVALIDEFQDTDPLQYEIFSKVFTQEEALLFLIGDPKQSIYGFRNADVFTYMQAAGDIANIHALDTNWRSEPELVRAVNTLFMPHPNPFLFEQIRFLPVRPARSGLRRLTFKGGPEPPLQLWFVKTGKQPGSKAPVSKAEISGSIAGCVAREITRLLNRGSSGDLRLGARVLGPGDIAVLVRTHEQARRVQQELSRRRVPCVLHSMGYLFESSEAEELLRLLTGLASPNDERLVRASLATSIMGVSGNGLAALAVDESAWQQRLDEFRRYHDIWNRHGFFHMFRGLMVQQQVKPRLMALPDGERRLTNLLHLSEELHATGLGMRSLLKWFALQMHPETPNQEQHLLRLESDAAAVKIVTIHTSKGLQYPVVFCPFAWAGSEARGSTALFHDRAAGNRLTLDLGSDELELHQQQAAEEALAENLRLLYVALTRAANRCYLAWGGLPGAETSAPAYLFHCRDGVEAQDVVQTTADRFMALGEDEMLEELRQYERLSSGAISLSEISHLDSQEYGVPHAAGSTRLACRSLPRAIRPAWQIASFSSLIAGQHEAEQPVGDEFTHLCLPEESIPAVPAGARTGTLLHDILEHVDFSQAEGPGLDKTVRERLAAFGFDLSLQPAVSALVRNALLVDLDLDGEQFRLARLGPRERVSELGFYFPLQPISSDTLQSLFAACGTSGLPAAIENLSFAPVQGFMKGSIDLVFWHHGRFYLVDWKSNLLGSDRQSYYRPNLQAVMQRDHYILQYHLYCLALDQYLRQRLRGYCYGQAFGGVYYIFLRGLDPVRGPLYGVYRDRPPEELIDAMRRCFIQTAP